MAFNNDTKLKHQEKHANKFITENKNNIKYEKYISYIYFGYI